MKHRHKWAINKLNSGTVIVDTFAFDYEFHNGPICISCGYSFCEHCSANRNKDHLKAFNEMTCEFDNELDDKPYTYGERSYVV